MMLRCINNEESRAPKGLIGPVQPHPEYVHESLTVGRDYIVYGLSIFADNLKALIANDSGYPRWYAPHFFESVDARLPAHWEFRYFVMESTDPWQRRTFQAMWGYSELVQNEDHNTGLQELEPADLEIFRHQVELSRETG